MNCSEITNPQQCYERKPFAGGKKGFCRWKAGKCVDVPPPPPGANQQWSVGPTGSTLVSQQAGVYCKHAQPCEPLCLGVAAGHDGTWNSSDPNQKASLANCSGAASQFSFDFSSETGENAGKAGTIVHTASGLCLTVGRCAAPPPPPPPGPKPVGTTPCDIYASAGTPCVAAHSTVRALYSKVL